MRREHMVFRCAPFEELGCSDGSCGASVHKQATCAAVTGQTASRASGTVRKRVRASRAMAAQMQTTGRRSLKDYPTGHAVNQVPCSSPNPSSQRLLGGWVTSSAADHRCGPEIMGRLSLARKEPVGRATYILRARISELSPLHLHTTPPLLPVAVDVCIL